MNSRSILTGLTALSLLTSLSACKPVRSEQASKPSQATQSMRAGRNETVLSNLEIDWVVSDDGDETPIHATSVSSDLLEGATRSESLLQLRKRLSIPYSKSSPRQKLFLALPYELGERRIVSASYEYRTVSANNVTQNRGVPKLLFRDDTHDRYFIPLDKLSQENTEGFSALDLQIVGLTLQLSDGSSAYFEVRFYVKGELPSLAQVLLSQSSSNPIVAQSANAPKISALPQATLSGWTVLAERYKNPTSRPLELWFSAQDVSFQLVTEMGMKVDPSQQTLERLLDGAGFEVGPQQFSKVSLERINVIVRDPAAMKSKVIPLYGGQSVPIEIAPGQTLEVEWRALATEKANYCNSGESVTRKFRVCQGYAPNVDPSVNWIIKAAEISDCTRTAMMGAYYDNPMALSGNWWVRSYTVKGQFKNQVFLTDEIGNLELTLQDAIQEGMALAIPVASFDFVHSVNPEPSFAPQASCQGIF